MKRLILFVLAVALLAGCKSTLKITNRSDPKNFEPVSCAGVAGLYFGEKTIDVPEEVRSDDFDITRADLFADIFADTIWSEGDVTVIVSFYLGLESGNVDLDDSDINQLLVTVTITEQDQHNLVEMTDPALLRKAIKQEQFYLKAVIELQATGVTFSIIHLDDIYFVAYLERETKGLFPIFYMF